MKSKVGKLLHEYGVSSNPLKQAITKTVLSMAELTGLKEKVAKTNLKIKKEEEKSLMTFVMSDAVTQNLESVNINSKLFKKEMLSNFIFNQDKLVLFMENFLKLIEELKYYYQHGFKLDQRQYDKVAGRLNLVLANYTAGQDYTPT